MKRIKTMLEKNINRVISMLMILILTMGLIGTNYRDVNAATIHTINNSLLDTVKSVSNVKLNSSTLADYEWKKGIDGKKEGDRFYLPIKSMQTSFSYDSPLKLYFENVMEEILMHKCLLTELMLVFLMALVVKKMEQ